MRDPPPSDEWVEAELERQLLDVDVSGESSDESEGASRSSFAIKSYEIPEVSLSFREFAKCLEEYGGAIAETTDALLQHAGDAVQDLERVARRLDINEVVVDGLVEKRRAWAEMTLAETPPQEDVEAGEGARAQCSPCLGGLASHEGAGLLTVPNAEPKEESSGSLWNSCALARESDMEETCQGIEAERISRLHGLEQEQQERLARMMRHEEAIREEQTRCQEEMAMFSEELRLRDFYESECHAVLREHRRLQAEDLHSQTVRREEQMLMKSQALARESHERECMSKEDEFARALLRSAAELREIACMELAEQESELLREESRRLDMLLQRRRSEELAVEERRAQEEEPAQKAHFHEPSDTVHGSARSFSCTPSCGCIVCSDLWQGLSPLTRQSARKSRNLIGDTADLTELLRHRSCPGNVCLEVLTCRDDLDTLVSLGGVVRLDLRSESLSSVPDLVMPRLKILTMTGNKIAELGPLSCTSLEELDVTQNQLTNLHFLAGLNKLAVLKANMNKIVDVDGVASHALRHVELSMNRVDRVRWDLPNLTKLTLYRNQLAETGFLERLPALTHLDIGRNKLTEVDARVSDWNPLLVKLILYENDLGSLPTLTLPLLTDLWINNNSLKVLGPLGCLPSLERMQAGYNNICSLGSPIASSPLLQSLSLGFNQLERDAVAPVFLHRLSQLQLNDNPVAGELAAGEYRLWVLSSLPSLQELDHEPVSVQEQQIANVSEIATPSAPVPTKLAAVEPQSNSLKWQEVCTLSCVGCGMCLLAARCQTMTRDRGDLLLKQAKEDRRLAPALSGCVAAQDALLALRRRKDLWDSLRWLCEEQFAVFVHAATGDASAVIREPSTVTPEIPTCVQRCFVRVQSRFRGYAARKRAVALRHHKLSQQQAGLVRVQACWRGWRSRLAFGVPTKHCVKSLVKMQAVCRGVLVRRRVRLAREAARVDANMDDCPEIDVDLLLGGLVELVDPFKELSIPDKAWTVTSVPSPMLAWGTSSPQFRPRSGGSVEQPNNVPTPKPCSRPLSSSGEILQRRTTASSLAESAVTEQGPRLSKVEQVQRDWNFEDKATARAYLAAQQKRRQKPPKCPGLRASHTSGDSGKLSLGSQQGLRAQRGSRSLEPVRPEGRCLKAQDQIAEYRRQVEEEAQHEAFHLPPLEFHSGEANRKLTRSTLGLFHAGASPRMRSPCRTEA